MLRGQVAQRRADNPRAVHLDVGGYLDRLLVQTAYSLWSQMTRFLTLAKLLSSLVLETNV